MIVQGIEYIPENKVENTVNMALVNCYLTLLPWDVNALNMGKCERFGQRPANICPSEFTSNIIHLLVMLKIAS
jgi:hypothetical protein